MASISTIEEKNIEGVMTGLMRELEKLAPHPGRLDETSFLLTGTRAGPLSLHFNTYAYRQTLIDAYLRDLPKRMGIERWLAEYQRKFHARQKHAPVPAF